MIDVTAITANFKTPDLLRVCIASFREHYPDLTYIVVDNGGCEDSITLLDELRDEYDLLTIYNSRNVGHGPALNEALALVGTRYAFTLDSDTETMQGGFLEKMLELFKEDFFLFATGWRRWVNAGGVAYPDQSVEVGTAYIHPYACLLDVSAYRGLAPFANVGAPAINLMRDALAQGWELTDFPIRAYIEHKGAGTRGMFGGRIRIATDEEPRDWRACRI